MTRKQTDGDGVCKGVQGKRGSGKRGWGGLRKTERQAQGCQVLSCRQQGDIKGFVGGRDNARSVIYKESVEQR